MNEFYDPFSPEEKEISDKPFVIAVADSVTSAGIRLTVDGETGTKRYKYNRDVSFSDGDRVLAVRVSGTYVVICRI